MTLVRCACWEFPTPSQPVFSIAGRWMAIQGARPLLSLIALRSCCCWWFAERDPASARSRRWNLAEGSSLQAHLGTRWVGVPLSCPVDSTALPQSPP